MSKSTDRISRLYALIETAALDIDCATGVGSPAPACVIARCKSLVDELYTLLEMVDAERFHREFGEHAEDENVAIRDQRKIIREMADVFFEWPSEDKSHVTTVSMLLFVEHCMAKFSGRGNA